MRFFDTHCHLNHDAFQSGLDEVLNRAVDSGIEYFIVPGWDLESSQKSIDLAEKYPQIYTAVGIHPEEIASGHPLVVDEIRILADHPKVVAIGEIGLDYYHDPVHIVDQQALLKDMLSIARECNKKVILHSRESMRDMKVLITSWVSSLRLENHPLSVCPGVFHAYEGDLADANELFQYNFKFGVGGPVTYKNSRLKREVFSSLPESAILYETDSPYLSPAKCRGKRNEPANLVAIAETLAEIRAEPKIHLSEQIFQNGYKMFIEDIIH